MLGIISKKALREANSWTCPQFGFDADRFSDLQGMMRYVYKLAMEKLDHLDTIPFLIARLGEDGVRDRCLLQYRANLPRSSIV